jgi:hypothetical protein
MSPALPIIIPRLGTESRHVELSPAGRARGFLFSALTLASLCSILHKLDGRARLVVKGTGTMGNFTDRSARRGATLRPARPGLGGAAVAARTVPRAIA